MYSTLLLAVLCSGALARPALQPRQASASGSASAASSVVSSATSAASSAASSASAVAVSASSASGVSSTASASSAAPSASSSASSYLDGLVAAIRARDAPALANLIASTPAVATALGGALSSGSNYTLIAPGDQGLERALATVDTTNTTLVTQLLSYHLVPGYHPADSFPVNETVILGTAINENLVFRRNQYLTTHIVGGQNATVLANSTYQNVLIKLTDNALHLPQNISATWAALQPSSQLLTTLTSILPNFVNQLDTSSALTVFAPTNQAIANVASAFTSLAANPSQLQTVLEGHIVNGSVIYSNAGASTLLNTPSVQSAAGTTLTFINNSTGSYVSSQGTTARIVQEDIITSNGPNKPGVIYLIDAVLVAPSNATTAAGAAGSSSASSAPSSASSASALPTAGAASASGSSSASRRSLEAPSSVSAAPSATASA